MGLFSSPPSPPPPPPPLPGASPPVPANPTAMQAMARRNEGDPTRLTREPGLLTSNTTKGLVAREQLGGGTGQIAAMGAAGPGVAGPKAG